MSLCCRSAVFAAIAFAILPQAGLAQPIDSSALPSRAALEEQAARRFPQPVRVGDLGGRKLLGPSASQPILGRVAAIVRSPEGHVGVVVRLAKWVWERERSVVVPVEAVALLGEHVALLDITAEHLRALPTFDPHSSREAGADQTIRVGLAKPFH